MPVDLSPYRIFGDEKPASSAKQNNTIQAIQDAINSIPASQIAGYPGAANLFLDGSGHWSAPPITNWGITVLSKWTQKVVSTTAKTDLLNGEITIPAGAMSATGVIKCWMGGLFTNPSGAAKTIQLELKLGPDRVIWDSGASDSLGPATPDHAWVFRGTLLAMNSIGVVHGGGYFGLSYPAAATTGRGWLLDTATSAQTSLFGSFAYGTTTNMSLAQALTFSATLSGGTMTLDYARFEVS
jgi:hypothetical protein